ncbi:unnamed protein product [Effrenium voratum]|nr:unnamed protein product [Effrenium voratum]
MASPSSKSEVERFFSAHSSLALREGEPGLPDVDAARRRRLRQILAHQLAAISVSVLTLHARSQLLLRALGPDRVADVGGTGAFLVALSDLALSPVIGRVSDLVGRRPLMLLLPAVGLPTKLLAACWPRPALLQLDRVLGDSLRTLCGTTMTMTCLADLYHGQRYAAALGYLQTATGLGLALGPMLAAALMGPRGQRPRLCFWAAALVAALHLVLGWRLLEETNEKLANKGWRAAIAETWQDGKDLLAAVRQRAGLFARSAALRHRAGLFLLHSMVEGKVLQEQATWVQLKLNWQGGSANLWTSAHGLALSASSWCGPLLRRWGEHRFLVACHVSSCLGFLCMRRTWLWWGLVPLLLGSQRRLVSASWLLQEACRAGLGRGEVVGLMATLRAASEGVISLLSKLAFQRSGDAPASIFLLPSALILLAETVRMRLVLHAEEGRQLLGVGQGFRRLELPPRREPLGLGLDLLDPAAVQICSIAEGSFVDRHNESAAEEDKIKVGDFILRANGTFGEADAIADILQSERRSLTLTLQRPARRRVSLPAGKEQAAASSLLLSLPESVTLYASRSLASLGLRRHDRVCAADGSSACAVRSAAELRQALERGEACDISIVRPGSEEA